MGRTGSGVTTIGVSEAARNAFCKTHRKWGRKKDHGYVQLSKKIIQRKEKFRDEGSRWTVQLKRMYWFDPLLRCKPGVLAISLENIEVTHRGNSPFSRFRSERTNSVPTSSSPAGRTSCWRGWLARLRRMTIGPNRSESNVGSCSITNFTTSAGNCFRGSVVESLWAYDCCRAVGMGHHSRCSRDKICSNNNDDERRWALVHDVEKDRCAKWEIRIWEWPSWDFPEWMTTPRAKVDNGQNLSVVSYT